MQKEEIGTTDSADRAWWTAWRPRLAGLLLTVAVAWPAHAQIEVNHASAEALMQLPGIGPVRAERIVQARAQRPFTDWADLQARVAGIGPQTAEALSVHGLRVQGRSYGQDVARGNATPAPRSAARREPPRAGEAALSSRPAAPAR